MLLQKMLDDQKRVERTEKEWWRVFHQLREKAAPLEAAVMEWLLQNGPKGPGILKNEVTGPFRVDMREHFWDRETGAMEHSNVRTEKFKISIYPGYYSGWHPIVEAAPPASGYEGMDKSKRNYNCRSTCRMAEEYGVDPCEYTPHKLQVLGEKRHRRGYGCRAHEWTKSWTDVRGLARIAVLERLLGEPTVVDFDPIERQIKTLLKALPQDRRIALLGSEGFFEEALREAKDMPLEDLGEWLLDLGEWLLDHRDW